MVNTLPVSSLVANRQGRKIFSKNLLHFTLYIVILCLVFEMSLNINLQLSMLNSSFLARQFFKDTMHNYNRVLHLRFNALPCPSFYFLGYLNKVVIALNYISQNSQNSNQPMRLSPCHRLTPMGLEMAKIVQRLYVGNTF